MTRTSQSFQYSDVFFIGLVTILVCLPVTCGEMSVQYVKRRSEPDKLLHEYQWRFEIYLPQQLIISVPSNSNNASISLTHLDVFGTKIIEEEELMTKSMPIRLSFGRHILRLNFNVPKNATTNDAEIQPTFVATIFVGPLSHEAWILVPVICSVIFVFGISRSLKQGVVTNKIIHGYKLLTFLIRQFQDEVTSKTLKYEFVDRVRSSYSNALPDVNKLRTHEDIQRFIYEHEQILGNLQEKRAALILQAILNLSEEIKQIASHYRSSIALSLKQTLDKNLISAIYRPGVDSLIQASKNLRFVYEVKSALDHAQGLMEKENVYVKIAKIISTSAIALLAMVILGFQPVDFLILKLPLFFYILSNLLAFVTRLK